MLRIHWLTALLSGMALGMIVAAIWLSIAGGPTAESNSPILAMLVTAGVIAAIAFAFATVHSRRRSKAPESH